MRIVEIFMAGLLAGAMVGACGSDSTNGMTPDDPASHTDAGTGVASDSGMPSDSGNTTSPRCGDHVCTATTESCATCAADCACASGKSCTGAEVMATCAVTNPLIATLPGRWISVEPTGFNVEVDVTVEADNPNCRFPQDPQGQGDPGDACVRHFDPPGSLILSGARLYRTSADAQDRVEGQVLEDGHRVEFDRWYNGTQEHFVFMKR